jgi:MscS family membrane protein
MTKRSTRRQRTLAGALARALPLLACLGATPAAPDVAARPERAAAPADPFDRGTPRDALYGYIVASREGDYERAAEYLDLSAVREAERGAVGPRVARRLKVVLDRELWIDWDLVDDTPEGARDDGLPPRLDRLGSLDTERGPVDVLLSRVSREDGARIWKISAATVGNVPALYDEFGYGPLGDRLPSFFFEVRFLDAELWQWAGLIVAVSGAYLLALLAGGLVLRVLRPIAARSATGADDELLDTLIGPARLGFAIVFFHLAAVPLRLSVGAQATLRGVEQALFIAAIAWVALRVIDVFGHRVETLLVVQGRVSATGLVPIGRRVVKVAVWLLAALAVLQNLGFEVTGLIAGLGVGGLAVALAAQKTLENWFGAFTLATDEPVKVGDFCRFGDRVGVVEEIGLRSTRVRTLARTIVSVPNADFAALQLENFTKRDQMWLKLMLGVRYETTPDQLRFLLAELRRLLLAHPKVLPDPARVRFVGFGAYSLDLELFAYVETTDWNEFLAIREDIFLRIMDVVEASGTGFAFPSQTVYTGKDGGLEDAKIRAAEAQVRAWREQSALPFPDFAEAQRAEVRDTLAYPPEGSARRAG